ncbi:pentapeptide repeat-containing protein [Micromonospora sicca]|uniref:pentapeptide repeat-containing protein n=1 Tax=Micromonospora sicca TaxID=2202420 RepID=UPI001374CB36|nr:pentapeptide repeat-containing protein [Micromonospora sp. 4G51]
MLGAVIAALLLAFALVVGPWLLTQHPQKGLTAEQALKAKNDVRTTLVQALAGLAVAGGAVVTYRTFRQTQVEQDRTYALRQGEQVNGLYTKAVEQLGHEQAPVRLGALYSLEQLAQANVEHRQTVVNVLCAYLRMPYSHPEELPASATPAQQRDASQELQVRLTAQRLLADHLRAPQGISGKDAQGFPASPDEPFWPGMGLDLSRAALFDFYLLSASVVVADFQKTIFSGLAGFNETTINGLAWFKGSIFTGAASFSDATFASSAHFNGMTVNGAAFFDGATFTQDVEFDKATFNDEAFFGDVTFGGDARFKEVSFGDMVEFNRAACTGHAWFEGATFARVPSFYKANFGLSPLSGPPILHSLDDLGRDEGGERGGVTP